MNRYRIPGLRNITQLPPKLLNTQNNNKPIDNSL